MAEVYDAVAQGSGAFSRRVALKKMRAEMLALEDAKRAFFDEASIASALHHANIVSILDYGTIDGGLFQVFELVEGLNLRELRAALLENGRAVEEELGLSIALQIAHALAYAHALSDEHGAPRKIVHRDVTPPNILISWTGDVKLADFGVAAATKRTDRTATGFIKGNLAYMAPEQAAGDPVDGRADIFALACALHAFLRGASPVEAKGAMAAALAGAEVAVDGALGSDVVSLLRAALRVDRAKRLPDMWAFAALLQEALRERGVADPRAVVLAAMEPLRAARPPEPEEVELDFRPVLMLTGVVGGVRRFMTEATPLGTPSSPDTHAVSEQIHEGGKLGPLVLVEHLSRGGFAEVYRAEHELLGRAYAVKVLRRRADSAKNRRRLEREARALAAVDHPHIVAIHDFGTSAGGQPYLVTELLEGRTVAARVRELGPMNTAAVAAIGAQLARALEHVHALGLVHRDLKPSNVMIVREAPMFVKLIDFGITRLVSLSSGETHLTAADDLLGTPAYMAPEQAKDPTAVSAASDLYALGGVLFYLLTGHAPVERTKLSTQSAVEAVIERLLSEAVEGRPKSAAEVAVRLEASLLPVVAPVLPPPAGRKWAFAALGLAAMSVGFAAYQAASKPEVVPPIEVTDVVVRQPERTVPAAKAVLAEETGVQEISAPEEPDPEPEPEKAPRKARRSKAKAKAVAEVERAAEVPPLEAARANLDEVSARLAACTRRACEPAAEVNAVEEAYLVLRVELSRAGSLDSAEVAGLAAKAQKLRSRALLLR